MASFLYIFLVSEVSKTTDLVLWKKLRAYFQILKPMHYHLFIILIIMFVHHSLFMLDKFLTISPVVMRKQQVI